MTLTPLAGFKRTTSSSSGRGAYRRAMWPLIYKLMESPTKNWSKLLTHRSFAVGILFDAGNLMQNHVQ